MHAIEIQPGGEHYCSFKAEKFALDQNLKPPVVIPGMG
jgi:hypothetical protein